MGIDKILIADPDFKFLASLKEGLQEFGQFKILTAHNGRQALNILQKHEVSILVTDIFMPEVDGLELLATITRQYPNVLSIVTIKPDNGTLKKQIAGDSLFSYLNKPYDHIRLHTELIRVLDCLDEIYFKPGLYLASILPLIYLARKTNLLVVTTEGNKTGSFSFKDGMLVEATCSDLRGEEAVREMIAWGPGKYTFKRLPKSQETSNIDEKLTSMILEGTGLVFKDEDQIKGIELDLGDLPDLTPAKVGAGLTRKATDPDLDDPLDQLIQQAKGPIPKKSDLNRKKAAPAHELKQKAASTVEQPTRDHRTDEPVSGDLCKVLVVDDSRMIRKGLLKILATDDKLSIVGEATNGEEALELIKKHRPDVVTLDINMPIMDGLSTLKHMMIQCPTPTVMLSTLTHEGTSVTFDTLKYGAVDFMPKPSGLISEDMAAQAAEILSKIHLASGVKMESVKYIRSVETRPDENKDRQLACKRVVCMGAAEGGYGALLKIIPKLSLDHPVAYIVMIHANPQHIDAFVNYLSRHSPMKIQRVKDGMTLQGATCYLASGSEELSLAGGSANGFTLKVQLISPAERTTINKLMQSMTELLQEKSIGVILSGAGDDGSEGLQGIKKTGGVSIVQNPANCLYKEMAEKAMNHVDRSKILPESKISETINQLCMTDNG